MTIPIATLNARRSELLAQLAATLAELPDAIAPNASAPRRAVLCKRVAGDMEATYVEQAWEALGGKPPLLSSFDVAQRKVRAAGLAEGEGGQLLAAILRGRAVARESARLLSAGGPTDAERGSAEATVAATVVQAYAQVTTILAGWFGDAELRAKALALGELAAGVADLQEVLLDEAQVEIGAAVARTYQDGRDAPRGDQP